MSLSTTIARVTETQIGRFGKTLTYLSSVPGAYNPSTSAANSADGSFSVKGMVEDVKDKELSAMILVGDKKVSIAAESFSIAPTISDSVSIDSIAYSIVDINIVYVVNDPVLYILQVRKT